MSPPDGDDSFSVKEVLTAVSTKVDNLEKNVAHIDEKIDRADNHDQRIRALEQWKWKMAGVTVAVVFVASAAGRFLFTLL